MFKLFFLCFKFDKSIFDLCEPLDYSNGTTSSYHYYMHNFTNIQGEEIFLEQRNYLVLYCRDFKHCNITDITKFRGVEFFSNFSINKTKSSGKNITTFTTKLTLKNLPPCICNISSHYCIFSLPTM